MRLRPRAVAAEATITVLVGVALAASSLGLLAYQYGAGLHLGTGDQITVAAAGVAAAAVVRVTARLHRRWKRTLGPITAAAALCALAAIAGTLVVMIPSQCPGVLFGSGRCGAKEAATWGETAGLAAMLNFMLIGLSLALFRMVRNVVGDAVAQCLVWIKMLARRGTDRQAPGRRRHPHEPKGRPTPRRAEAEQARRQRLRARG